MTSDDDLREELVEAGIESGLPLDEAEASADEFMRESEDDLEDDTA